MKKITALFLSLMIALSCSIPIFGATTEELEKKEMLELIEKQLIEQDAERFLPVYEQYLDLMYSNQNESTRSGPYERPFRTGGIIYYENFLNTKVEMCNTYLSEEMFNEAYSNPEPSDYALGIVNDVVISLGFLKLTSSYIITGFYAAYAYIFNENDKAIIRAGAAYNSVTQDSQGRAQVTLPWNNFPNASYYSGATIRPF